MIRLPASVAHSAIGNYAEVVGSNLTEYPLIITILSTVICFGQISTSVLPVNRITPEVKKYERIHQKVWDEISRRRFLKQTSGTPHEMNNLPLMHHIISNITTSALKMSKVDQCNLLFYTFIPSGILPKHIRAPVQPKGTPTWIRCCLITSWYKAPTSNSTDHRNMVWALDGCRNSQWKLLLLLLGLQHCLRYTLVPLEGKCSYLIIKGKGDELLKLSTYITLHLMCLTLCTYWIWKLEREFKENADCCGQHTQLNNCTGCVMFKTL